jgi:hypothetical protein
MLAGHMLATAATAWVFLKGETALELLLAWLSPLRPVPAPVLVLPAGPRRFVRDCLAIPAPWRNLRVHSRRGPPAFVLV